MILFFFEPYKYITYLRVHGTNEMNSDKFVHHEVHGTDGIFSIDNQLVVI